MTFKGRLAKWHSKLAKGRKMAPNARHLGLNMIKKGPFEDAVTVSLGDPPNQ